MDNQEELGKAIRVVNAKMRFHIHLGAFLFVNTLLLIINLTTSPEYFWFIWPLLGWGLGLVIHGLVVFARMQGSSLHEHMIERELRRRRKNQGLQPSEAPEQERSPDLPK